MTKAKEAKRWSASIFAIALFRHFEVNYALHAFITVPIVTKEASYEVQKVQQQQQNNAKVENATWAVIREALSIHSYPNVIDIPLIAVPGSNCKAVYVEHIFYLADILGELNSTVEEAFCLSTCNLVSKCFSVNYLPNQKRCFLLGSGLTLSDIESLNIHDSIINSNLSSRHYLFNRCYDDSGKSVTKMPNAPTFEPLPANFTGQCGLSYYEPSIADSKTRIVGGSTASPYVWPWMISLKTDLRHFCGGTIIRPATAAEESDIVLTAAHCVTDSGKLRTFKNLAAVLGAYSQSTAGRSTVSVIVDRMVVHPDYNPGTVINDVAVLLLRRPVKFSRTISPVCLASDSPPLGSLCVDVGWGNVIELLQDGGMPDLLQQLKVPTPIDSVCAKPEVWGNVFQPKYMICAGYPEGKRNVCSGDSGGPLLCKSNGRWTQYGVASFVAQDGCKTENKPGVFARVSAYNNWITRTTFNLTKVGKKPTG